MNQILSTAAQAVEDGITRRDVLKTVPAITLAQAMEVLMAHAESRPLPYVPIQAERNGVLIGGVIICNGENHFDRLLALWPKKAN